MHISYKHMPLVVLIALMGCALGCSSGSTSRIPTFRVTGTVTLNGKPVEGAVVNFIPLEGKSSAIGSSDAQGNYSLSTYAPADGAPEGQYKISISKFDGAPPPAAAAAATPPPGTLAPGGLPEDYTPPTAGGGGGPAKPAGLKNLLPAKFANADTSALRATVEKGGTNKFDFDLK